LVPENSNNITNNDNNNNINNDKINDDNNSKEGKSNPKAEDAEDINFYDNLFSHLVDKTSEEEFDNKNNVNEKNLKIDANTNKQNKELIGDICEIARLGAEFSEPEQRIIKPAFTNKNSKFSNDNAPILNAANNSDNNNDNNNKQNNNANNNRHHAKKYDLKNLNEEIIKMFSDKK